MVKPIHILFFEVSSRAFKDIFFFLRVEADEKKVRQTYNGLIWFDCNFEIMLTYNDKMKHSATAESNKER